jgi:hypothetical protein
MRHLIFILFLVAALVTAGCVGGDQKPAATPTPPVYKTVHVTLSPMVTATPTSIVTPVVTSSPFVIRSLVTTLTDAPSQSGYQTYTNNEFKFTIQIPKSWKPEGQYVTAVGTVKKYVVDFTDPAFKSKQDITITPNSAGLSLGDWANIFTNQVKTDPSVSVVSQSESQVDGVPAKKLVLIQGSGEFATESTIILVVNGENAYLMEFMSRKNDYAGYSQDADSMINSFRFT